MTLSLDSVIDHSALGLDDDDLIELYRLMVLARKLDERMWALNRQGRVPFVVSVSGHEATQVGAAYAIDPSKDWSMPYYRDVAFALAAGMSPRDVFAGVFAKDMDPSSGGRQMPNHWSEPDLNIFTQSSVIGVQYPQACGVAYELQRTGSDAVVVVDGGEGSTSEGDWHEAMNFAGIHKLPVIFLIQNNLYAISVPAASEVAGEVANRAHGYGMPGVVVDGNNVLEVYGAMAAAVERARNGEGPSLIEAKTYRYYAHTSDDDDKLYRSREEVELWRRKDPIPNFRQYLVEQRVLTEAREREIDEEVVAVIAEAVKETEAAPDPMDPLSHVYSKPIVPTEPQTSVESVPEGPNGNLITAINQTLHELMDEHDNMVVFG
ncbi:MAG: thiamine pyrophosphate-dependent dehydrogenase E1 component subunit alpha, partial [Acidimicrobiia bacterium]